MNYAPARGLVVCSAYVISIYHITFCSFYVADGWIGPVIVKFYLNWSKLEKNDCHKWLTCIFNLISYFFMVFRGFWKQMAITTLDKFSLLHIVLLRIHFNICIEMIAKKSCVSMSTIDNLTKTLWRINNWLDETTWRHCYERILGGEYK